MTTIETVPLAPSPQGWTVEDVDALPENGLRYELVDGVPRVMTPPKFRHQKALKRLDSAVEAAAPGDLSVVQGVGVILAPDQRPIPDLVVLRDADPELSNFPAAQVLLAAEVVSPSSRSDDRFRKPGIYAQAGIAVYLRVELDPPHVVAYRIGPGGRYVETGRAEPGQVLTLEEPFPLTLDPADLLS